MRSAKAAACSSLILLLALAAPEESLSQAVVVVQGRVIEFGTSSAIQNAVVELEGLGSTLTSADGTFRFNDVRPGGYAVHVIGFGYAPHSEFIVVERDSTLSFSLEIAPFALDSLVIEQRAIELEGRVRDPELDIFIIDATVLSSQGGAVTDAHGRFRLEPVFTGVPLRLSVRVFGYLPLDSTIVPRDGEAHVFDLSADPLVTAMIGRQVERLVDRASGRRSVMMRPLDRDRLLRYDGGTLRDVIESQYRSYIDQIRCVIIDEEQFVDSRALLTWLGTTLPQEVERIEFLAFGPRSRDIMLRIYTRRFIQEMTARYIALRDPVFVGMARPPWCL